MSSDEVSALLSAYLKPDGAVSDKIFAALAQKNERIAIKLKDVQSLSSLSESDRRSLRTDFYLLSGSIAKLSCGSSSRPGWGIVEAQNSGTNQRGEAVFSMIAIAFVPLRDGHG